MIQGSPRVCIIAAVFGRWAEGLPPSPNLRGTYGLSSRSFSRYQLPHEPRSEPANPHLKPDTGGLIDVDQMPSQHWPTLDHTVHMLLVNSAGACCHTSPHSPLSAHLHLGVWIVVPQVKPATRHLGFADPRIPFKNVKPVSKPPQHKATAWSSRRDLLQPKLGSYFPPASSAAQPAASKPAAPGAPGSLFFSNAQAPSLVSQEHVDDMDTS